MSPATDTVIKLWMLALHNSKLTELSAICQQFFLLHFQILIIFRTDK